MISPGGLHLPSVMQALAEADPHRHAIVQNRRVTSYRAFVDRAAAFAGVLAAAGLGCATERGGLAGHQRGQSLVGLMLYNGPEYLEAMLGSFAARCAPANVTWRSTAEELAYLLTDSGCEALVYDHTLADTVANALTAVDRPHPLLLEVGTSAASVPGAVDFEGALARATPVWHHDSADDLYVLYTGGTTGRPKGTLWRQADFAAGALGVRHRTTGEAVAAAATGARLRTLPAPPLIHGAAQWNAWSTLLAGGTVVVQSVVDRFDPDDVLHTIRAHGVTSLQIVGDAFGRPLLDALHRRPRPLPTLRFITSGGTVLSEAVRGGLACAIPGVTVVDILGSSESGRLAVATYPSPGAADPTARASGFQPSGGAVVVDDDRSAIVPAGSTDLGWLATTGPIPLGYLGDAARSQATFPLIDGVRYSVPGDRARWRADGTIEVLGRDAAVINTGGEKVFAEEVEVAIATLPGVVDALVVGRAHPTLGSEVCAVVAVRAGYQITLDHVRHELGRHLARYKLPRHLVLTSHVVRSPAGKPDYSWARAQVNNPPDHVPSTS